MDLLKKPKYLFLIQTYILYNFNRYCFYKLLKKSYVMEYLWYKGTIANSSAYLGTVYCHQHLLNLTGVSTRIP